MKDGIQQFNDGHRVDSTLDLKNREEKSRYNPSYYPDAFEHRVVGMLVLDEKECQLKCVPLGKKRERDAQHDADCNRKAQADPGSRKHHPVQAVSECNLIDGKFQPWDDAGSYDLKRMSWKRRGQVHAGVVAQQGRNEPRNRY